MKSSSLGTSVTEAVAFLETVYADVKALNVTLTQQMDAANWENRQDNVIRPRQCDLDYCTLYAPTAPRGTKDLQHAIMVQIVMAATGFSNTPLLLAVAANHERRVTKSELWRAWTFEGGIRVMKFLSPHAEGLQIPVDVLKPDFAPLACKAAGLVLPLFSVENAAEVQERVVNPILLLAEKCGFKTAGRTTS